MDGFPIAQPNSEMHPMMGDKKTFIIIIMSGKHH